MREALHRKSIGAHEAQMLFLDLHAAAQVGTAGVSRKSQVHRRQTPKPKAKHVPGFWVYPPAGWPAATADVPAVQAGERGATAGMAGWREPSEEEEAGGGAGDPGWAPPPGCEGLGFELPGTEAEAEAFLALPVVQDIEGEADARSVARLLCKSVVRGAALLGAGEETWKAARPRLGYAGGLDKGGGEGDKNDGAGGSEWKGGEGGWGERGGGGRGMSGSGESESGPRANFAAPERRHERGAGSHPRRVIDLLHEGGWTCVRARKHRIYKRTVSTSGEQTFTMASTPSDCRAHRAEVARLRKLDAEVVEAVRAVEVGGTGAAAGVSDSGWTATGGCGAAARITDVSINNDAVSQRKRRKGKAGGKW
jgi:hypothetical protein